MTISVTHEFDEYNNLSLKINYHNMEFTYIFAESYLLKSDEWQHIISDLDRHNELILDSGDTQSYQPFLSLKLPNEVKVLYINELKKAISCKRINTIVD